MVGQTLGHYRIEEKIGEGGMGVVYRARDTHLDRLVAIKVLRPDAVTNPERKRRFVQEAKSASALNHPNIITIYDISNEGGTDYIAMEYVAGQPLDRLLGRRGLTLREALPCAIQIAGALAAAHEAGIVHRDLKPGNVMVSEKGHVKLLDFGLAKLTEPAETDPSDSTQTLRPDDRGRHDCRYRRLHVTRAGRGQKGGCPLRHLLFRLRPLRNGDRPQALSGRDPDVDAFGNPPQGTAAGKRNLGRGPTRSRKDCRAVSAQRTPPAASSIWTTSRTCWRN